MHRAAAGVDRDPDESTEQDVAECHALEVGRKGTAGVLVTFFLADDGDVVLALVDRDGSWRGIDHADDVAVALQFAAGPTWRGLDGHTLVGSLDDRRTA